jgi:tetratricopeptide (TPR) repeat protein
MGALKTAKEDTFKVNDLNWLSSYYLWEEPKTSIAYGLSALSLSQKLHYKKGAYFAYGNLGEAFGASGDFTNAIKLKFKCLQLAEELGKTKWIANAYLTLSATFVQRGDYQQSIQYAKKAIATSSADANAARYLNGFQGEAFFKLNLLDSAIFYLQKAYELDLVSEDHWSIPYYNLAAIYAQKEDYQRAVEYYIKGLSFNPPEKDIAMGYIGLAKVFHQMHHTDSALYYMHKTIEKGIEKSFLTLVADAGALGSSIYKEKGLYDSAFYYQELMITIKDSLFSQEQIKQVQNLTLNEQLRQQELEARKLKEVEQRNHNLQYAGISIGLITIIVLFLLLSHSVIANKKLIRFLGIIALLMVFEFINLLLHPYLGALTHHSPMLMLLAMVCIAALLVPLHHRLEHWITHQMVEKNNRIRLAAARKTIEKLEKKDLENVEDSTSAQHQL